MGPIRRRRLTVGNDEDTPQRLLKRLRDAHDDVPFGVISAAASAAPSVVPSAANSPVRHEANFPLPFALPAQSYEREEKRSRESSAAFSHANCPLNTRISFSPLGVEVDKGAFETQRRILIVSAEEIRWWSHTEGQMKLIRANVVLSIQHNAQWVEIFCSDYPRKVRILFSSTSHARNFTHCCRQRFGVAV